MLPLKREAVQLLRLSFPSSREKLLRKYREGSLNSTKILIVDDELIMRESLAGWLERDGRGDGCER